MMADDLLAAVGINSQRTPCKSQMDSIVLSAWKGIQVFTLYENLKKEDNYDMVFVQLLTF